MDARLGQQSRPTGPQDRDLPCSECGLLLPPADHRTHLIAVHGYVGVEGQLLARPVALAFLWERVFTSADSKAHDHLCVLLVPAEVREQTSPAPYVQALQAEILRHTDRLFSSDRQPLTQLVECLRHNRLARPLFWQLLAAESPYVRTVGRELLLPEAGEALARPGVSLMDVQRWLDDLCPQEDVWEKLRLCRRLAELSVDEGVVRHCLQRLRAGRPVACPECGQAVPQDELDEHLRRVHRLYQFQGMRRSVEETRAAVLAVLCRPNPEPGSWPVLATLAREEYGTQADAMLAAWLGEALEKLPEDVRVATVGAVAGSLADSQEHVPLATLLAGRAERAARHLALSLAASLRGPVDPTFLAAICPVVAEKRLPSEARIAAAAALVGIVGKESPAAIEIVTALSSNSGKARAVERLRELERCVGPVTVVSARIATLEDQMHLRCPRCGLQLRRPEMIRHLWLQHQLVLAGRRVREPWQLVEDWIEEYRSQNDAELLARCRAFGIHLDPEGGLQRVYRLFLARQIEDAEAREALLAEAQRHAASLCPYCYGLVPVSQEAMLRPLDCCHGRLAAKGYRIEVSESGLIPYLEIETPEGLVFQGPEPGRWLTHHGATLLLGGPPIVSALAVAMFLSAQELPSLQPVVLLLALALALLLGVRWHGRKQPGSADRAIDHAWNLLVPRLQANGLSQQDSAFVACLALTSLEHGQLAARTALLEQLLESTEQAVAAGSRPVAHLTALRRLALEDAAALGGDLVLLTVEQWLRCLEGELPMVFAEYLLADWESARWRRGNRARLRVLLCDRAFESGWEVRDLLELGRGAPALATLLGTDRPEELAQLRLLWSLRPSRPWDRSGQAMTVFELAADADLGRRILSDHETLLLADRATPAVLLTSSGVIFQDVVFGEVPMALEVRAERGPVETRYALIVGDQSFPFAVDPTPVRERLGRWFDYHFGQFLPAVAEVYGWQTPGAAKTVQLEEPTRCPDCHGLLLARAGTVGIGAGAAPSRAESREADAAEVGEES